MRCHVLVKPKKSCVFIILNALCIALIRIAVFVFASIAMGNLLLFPMPQDTACTPDPDIHDALAEILLAEILVRRRLWSWFGCLGVFIW